MLVGSEVLYPLVMEFRRSGFDVQGPRFKGLRLEGQRYEA